MKLKNKPGPKGPRKYTDEFIEKEADKLLAWIKVPSNMFLNRFALENNYSGQRISEMVSRSPKFAAAVREAKEWQELKLIEGGLANKFNPYITKLVLQNCHGWSDKPEREDTQVKAIELTVHPCMIKDDNKSEPGIHS